MDRGPPCRATQGRGRGQAHFSPQPSPKIKAVSAQFRSNDPRPSRFVSQLSFHLQPDGPEGRSEKCHGWLQQPQRKQKVLELPDPQGQGK